MTTIADFEEWISWARNQFTEDSEYPLIDQKVYKYDYLPDAYSGFGMSNESVLQFFVNAMASAPTDIVPRFVGLNYYYELAHFDAIEKEDFVAERRTRFKRDLELLVRFQKSGMYTDPEVIRWEIVNAAAVQDWERGAALYNQLRSLNVASESHNYALRGQFYFTSVFVTRSDTDPTEPSSLSLWRPIVYRDWTFDALLLCVWSLLPAKELPFSPEELNRIGDAANDLEKALRASPDLPPLYRLMLARCHFAKSAFLDAAKGYELLSQDQRLPQGGDWNDFFTGQLYSCASRAYRLAGDLSKAKQAAEQWSTAFPNDPQPLKNLAQVYAQNADYQAAYTTLRRLVEQDPTLEHDWKVDIALALGGVQDSPERLRAELTRCLNSHPEERAFIDSIASILWSKFSVLGEESRSDWVGGLFLVYDGRLRTALGPTAPKAAVSSFGQVVERELAARIFEPFASHLRRQKADDELVEPQDSPNWHRMFRRYVAKPSSFLTLGQMCEALQGTRTPQSTLMKAFARWLEQERAAFVQRVAVLNLSRIAMLRNNASHASGKIVSAEDAKEMCRLCYGLLSAL